MVGVYSILTEFMKGGEYFSSIANFLLAVILALMEDSIRQFLSGTNTTIFAYGQTGAGKTYSIIGNYSPNDSQ